MTHAPVRSAPTDDGTTPGWSVEEGARASSLRKAAILVISLDETTAAQLLAKLERSAVEAVTLEMAHLERVDPDEQRAVLEEFFELGRKRLLFSFEDMARLDDHAIRVCYADEDAPQWALALASASAPVRARALEALPASVAEGLNNRLAHLGPFRLAAAEAAQAELTERVRRLHDLGLIALPDPDGQEEFLV